MIKSALLLAELHQSFNHVVRHFPKIAIKMSPKYHTNVSRTALLSDSEAPSNGGL
jgi:hypothetical protein